MSEAPQWEFYASPSGRSPVRDEIAKAKLSKQEARSLAKLLVRYAEGRSLARDVKYLKQYSLYELRLAADHRTFRLLFVPRHDSGVTLLALVFTEKKSRKLPSSVFEKAIQRQEEWIRRQVGR